MATEDAKCQFGVTDTDHDSDDEVFDACVHCEETFETGVRYPVTTRREPDGTLLVLSFCDESCQQAWQSSD